MNAHNRVSELLHETYSTDELAAAISQAFNEQVHGTDKPAKYRTTDDGRMVKVS